MDSSWSLARGALWDIVYRPLAAFGQSTSVKARVFDGQGGEMPDEYDIAVKDLKHQLRAGSTSNGASWPETFIALLRADESRVLADFAQIFRFYTDCKVRRELVKGQIEAQALAKNPTIRTMLTALMVKDLQKIHESVVQKLVATIADDGGLKQVLDKLWTLLERYRVGPLTKLVTGLMTSIGEMKETRRQVLAAMLESPAPGDEALELVKGYSNILARLQRVLSSIHLPESHDGPLPDAAKVDETLRDVVQVLKWQDDTMRVVSQLASVAIERRLVVSGKVIDALADVPINYREQISLATEYRNRLASEALAVGASARDKVPGEDVIVDSDCRAALARFVLAADQVAELLIRAPLFSAASLEDRMTCLFELYWHWRGEPVAMTLALFRTAHDVVSQVNFTSIAEDQAPGSLTEYCWPDRLGIVLATLRTLGESDRAGFVSFLAAVWCKAKGGDRGDKQFEALVLLAGGTNVGARSNGRSEFEMVAQKLAKRMETRSEQVGSEWKKGFYTEYDLASAYRRTNKPKNTRVKKYLDDAPAHGALSIAAKVRDWVLEKYPVIGNVAFISKLYCLHKRLVKGENYWEARITSADGKDGLAMCMMRHFVKVNQDHVKGFKDDRGDPRESVRKSAIGQMVYDIYYDHAGNLREDEFSWTGHGHIPRASICDDGAWTRQFGLSFRMALEDRIAAQDIEGHHSHLADDADRLIRCLFLVPINPKWKPEKQEQNAIYDAVDLHSLHCAITELALTHSQLRHDVYEPMRKRPLPDSPRFFKLASEEEAAA